MTRTILNDSAPTTTELDRSWKCMVENDWLFHFRMNEVYRDELVRIPVEFLPGAAIIGTISVAPNVYDGLGENVVRGILRDLQAEIGDNELYLEEVDTWAHRALTQAWEAKKSA